MTQPVEDVPPVVPVDETGNPVPMVALAHPNLPDQPISVRPDAVGHYHRSGWREVEPPAEAAPAELTDMTKDQLAAEAESRGLPKSGTKDELIARLSDEPPADNPPPEES